jgi:glutaminyl-tRNA synthetase
MVECAELLIRKGLAYVDSQPTEAIREGRGTVTEPGVESPYRSRTPAENLELFRRMRAGEFDDGEHVLRGKIDMTSPNMLMRDPVFYRIRHAHHYKQGDEWCIYPLYDFAHCLEDAFEGVTHSICTLEFDNNRELYDWVLDHVGFEEPRPHQYEWAGLDLEGAVLSKRFIKPLVQAGLVSGWDDPRLGTIAAYRRRGVPPEAVRLLAQLVGVSRAPARTEEAKLDFAIREVLNPVAPRVMAVLDPLKVVITNYPEGRTEEIAAPYFPHDVPREGSRPLPFSREVWIERSDFAEDPPKGFRRLVPGGQVRLRHAYVIRCEEVVKDQGGAIVELRCSYDPSTKSGGEGTSGGPEPSPGAAPKAKIPTAKVKGTIHWVSAAHALAAEVRLFGRLLLDGDQAADGEEDVAVTAARLNPESLTVLSGAWVEPSVASDPPDTRYQFERNGYFWRDPVDGVGDRPAFNRIVSLKDTWARREAEATTAPATTQAASPRERATTGSAAPAAPQRHRVHDPAVAALVARYRTELGVAEEHADYVAGAPDFFESALAVHEEAAVVAAWIAVDLKGLLEGRSLSDLPFEGDALGRLAGLVESGRVSRRAGKDVLARMVREGGDPDRLVDAMGLAKVSDPDALGAAVDAVLARWPDKVAEFRDGKSSLIGLFVGEVMKHTRGAADPLAARRILSERLARRLASD